ncbi:hypothetical protein ABQE48_13880 [Mycolicibacterium thermoresistibile]
MSTARTPPGAQAQRAEAINTDQTITLQNSPVMQLLQRFGMPVVDRPRKQCSPCSGWPAWVQTNPSTEP